MARSARESTMRHLPVLLLLLGLLPASAEAATPAQAFVVFFQEWSAALDRPAQTVIRDAAAYARSHPREIVHVNGYADPTGSRKANTLLAELRMQVVIDGLHADGVPQSRMVGHGAGPVNFALTSQESRRVAITIDKR